MIKILVILAALALAAAVILALADMIRAAIAAARSARGVRVGLILGGAVVLSRHGHALGAPVLVFAVAAVAAAVLLLGVLAVAVARAV